MDRFESEYHKVRFPDKQDIEPNIYSTCAGCNEVIYEGEEVMDILNGLCIHDDYDCLYKAVGAKRMIAGQDY